MPRLEKIIISNFRNIAFAELSFVPGVNCICGLNGQGKTSLLDAVYYLSMTKSSLGVNDGFLIRHGEDSFSLSGSYVMSDGMQTKFSVSCDSSSKTFRRDGKALPRISSHIGVLPVVMVSPMDSALVSESGDERRRFANMVLSQMDASYMSALQTYNKLLAQRNKLLKDPAFDASLLDVLDMQMDAPARLVVAKRAEFCNMIRGRVASLYELLSGGREHVEIEYKSELCGRDGTVADLSTLLAAGRSRDLLLKYTGCGVQRDDFLFTLDGYPIRRCGSQGQQKSFLVALKLAQYSIMKEACGFPPMLLLDDVFDKLDVERISNLLKIVSSEDYGQIFITDTNRERMAEIVGRIASDALYFTTENGEFQTYQNSQDQR